MSRINGSNFTRTTSLMMSNNLLSALRRTNNGLLERQIELSTGKAVNRPSDAPDKASAILALQQKIETRGQQDRNLQHALSILNNTDQALGDITDILLEARSIASSQIGVGSDEATRKNQATVIDAQLQAVIDIANRTVQGVSLFGGNSNGGAIGSHPEPVFVEFLGGVRYVGSRQQLAGDVGLDQFLSFNSTGTDAFNALSSRVQSLVDLDPQANADTRIAHVNGALGEGVRKGNVVVTVNGTEVIVDLASADTLGDVVTRVNDAIDSVDPAAGALAISGPGFELAANAGHTITIAELGAGKTAGDLGINLTAAGATVAGGDIDVRLTALTRLADLGATVDFTGGLKVSNGIHSKIADFSTATTVQDLINVVEQLNLGIRMEINSDGTSLNMVNEISGLEMAIGENAGGSTASDLGLRSFAADSRLDDLRFGLGVTKDPDGDEFAIELHDGTRFGVDIDAATTVGEVLALIQAAAAGAGLTVGQPGDGGTDFNVGMAVDGNGFQFEDNTAGAGEFRIVNEGLSLAATDLGILKNAGAGATINGDDTAKVRSESVFTHLINLRDSLLSNDERGITFAGGDIEQDVDAVVRARADIGARAQRVERQQTRSEDLSVAELTLLSELQDADFTEAITRFQQLQLQLQATMQAGAQTQQLSFLNFLR